MARSKSTPETKSIVNNPVRKKANSDRNFNINLMGNYSGASQKSVFKGFFATGGDANSTDLKELPELRNRSEAIVRNSTIGKAVINAMVDGAIGSGLHFQPSIDRDFLHLTEVEAQIHEKDKYQRFRFHSESKNIDYYNKTNFRGLQRQALRSMLVRGDCFALLRYDERPHSPYNLRVQLLEADRVSNPNNIADGSFLSPSLGFGLSATDQVFGGIAHDKKGIRKGIFIQTPHPGSYTLNTKQARWEYISFFGINTGLQQVLHIADLERIGQDRGVSVLAPIIELVLQHGRYREAEVMAAVINAILTVSIERNPPESQLDKLYGEELDDDGNVINKPWQGNDYELGPGTMLENAPYEKANMMSANRPSSQFDPFFISVVKEIGMAMRIPFELLLNDFNSSYSASRAAMLQGKKTYMAMMELFVENFCQPVWDAFNFECVVRHMISADGYIEDQMIRHAYNGVYWIAPPIGAIDELKEANAAAKRVQMGVSALSLESPKLTGYNYHDVCRIQAEDKKVAKSYGLNFDDVKTTMLNERQLNDKMNKDIEE